jgi:hypothetical protein
VSGPERYEAVLLLQQPALANAVNAVTGCPSIGEQESIQPESPEKSARLDRERNQWISSSARATIITPEAVTATAAMAGANFSMPDQRPASARRSRKRPA